MTGIASLALAMTSVGDATHHLAETAIHIGDFSAHAGSQIGEQKRRHIAHIVNGDVAANRGVGGHHLQNLAKAFDA